MKKNKNVLKIVLIIVYFNKFQINSLLKMIVIVFNFYLRKIVL
jgi:hypothetical protein